MTTRLVEAVGVTKTYRSGRRTVATVGPLDLTLGAGELVAIVGPSLSGKTTVVNLLAGWERPDDGTVEWPHSAVSPPAWTDVTVIPQAFALIDELTVTENITLPQRVNSAAGSPSDLGALLDALDLAPLAERAANEISVGERQRVMVARALASAAPVVIADDPVAHQDERRADAVLQLLRGVALRGNACLIATRTPEVASLADRVVNLAG
jgi:putative ABC transport system ATP-binding protein